MAVLRANLLDVRLVLSRAVVYGVISAVSVLTYVSVLALTWRWDRDRADIAVSVLATVLVGLLLGTVKSRVERWVEAALFGRREQAGTLTADLVEAVGRHADPSRVTTEVADRVRASLGAAHVRVEPDAGPAGASGRRRGDGLRLPLVHHGHALGTLVVVGGRASPTAATEAAAQVASAMWSVHLSEELQRARTELVRSREDERLRVRRDLHDGIGPVLAAAALQVDSLRRRLDPADGGGREIAERVKVDLRRALDDVRSLVDDLRPPALGTASGWWVPWPTHVACARLGRPDRASPRRRRRHGRAGGRGGGVPDRGEGVTNVLRHCGGRRWPTWTARRDG